MNIRALLLLLTLPTAVPAADLSKPFAPADLLFEEKDGLVAIEAEHFFEQTLTEQRAWYLTTKETTPDFKPDPDPNHVAGASGGAYLEILPDTRRTHADKLIKGVNFTNEPGKAAILSYKVHFNTPGKYWLWARAHSTGSEDNGLHFGINNTWPETAQRWQTVVKNRWHWQSAQRTEKVHIGVPGILTLDVPSAGPHTIHISMREDGIELDKILLVNRKDYTPKGLGPKSAVKAGTAPKPFPFVKDEAVAAKPKPAAKAPATHPLELDAANYDLQGSGYYLDQGKWLGINPEQRKTAKITTPSPFPSGKYHVTLKAVGESDGSSTYSVAVNDTKIGDHTCPMSTKTFDEGPKYHATWQAITINTGDVIDVSSTVASADGKEWSRARWSGLSFAPADQATKEAVAKYKRPAARKPAPKPAGPALQQPRQPDGNGSIALSGELKQWHKVTLTLDGPYAHEKDNKPNPFTDYELTITFTHESGAPNYTIPGYFAADGKAGESSAESGTKWRAHLSPDKAGKWNYTVSFLKAPGLIFGEADAVGRVLPLHEKSGSFTIAASDKAGRDLRAHGRLSYVGKHHLQFAGSKEYFLKAGADAPETLLGYADFDGTEARKAKKVPLKHYKPHLGDWKTGDPTWKGGKGKGLIGALNYLSGTGANAYSFLPYNAGGDGDNVWPFIGHDDKFHYDCSKLDQWGIVFDHGTAKGLFAHFKLQETENDDNNRGGHKGPKIGHVPAALDGGDLGPERKLYLREIIARYGHLLALNWNLGEENTQTTKQQMDMANFIADTDPYDHHIVIHTYPNRQDQIYPKLMGSNSPFTGTSLQNSNVRDCHSQVVKWTRASAKAGKPWGVAFDEPGDASFGMPADPDYPGMPKDYKGPTIHDTRKYVLWGTILGGGWGVEYYFGYKLPQNDLVCEDWRSRDQSWNYCRIALEFFRDQKIPFQEMANHDALVGNDKHDNSAYCYAKKGLYLVYLPNGGNKAFQTLPGDEVNTVQWFNPRTGALGQPSKFSGGQLSAQDQNDWLAIIRK